LAWIISNAVGFSDFKHENFFFYIRHVLGKTSNAVYLNKSVTLNDAFAVAKKGKLDNIQFVMDLQEWISPFEKKLNEVQLQ